MFITSILILWLLIKFEAPTLLIVLGSMSVASEIIYAINDLIVTIAALVEFKKENKE